MMTMPELDCLLVRQPYASLIAFGSKRWEFRSYDSKKRGTICIASSKGSPLQTGDSYLNSISGYFPRGFVLATADLTDSYLGTSEDLRKLRFGKETVKIHDYKLTTASIPLGEPLSDIILSMNDDKWQNYIWVLKNVVPLKNMLPLKNGNGSIWTKVELNEKQSLTKSIQSFL